MKTIKYLSILCIAAIFASCTKGDTGATGPAGANGANGVANISSYQYVISPGDWASNSNYWYYVDLSASAISNSNSDLVVVDVSEYSTGDWFGLPTSSFAVYGDGMEFDYYDGGVRVQYSSTNGSSSGTYPNITLYFKVSIIPPAIQIKYPKVNWKNTAEIMQIPEMQAVLANGK